MSDTVGDSGPTMRVELAFFQGNELLCHGSILIDREARHATMTSESGHEFRISYTYDDPACSIMIHCFADGELVARSALSMGVHTSDDWEAISLAGPYELCFRCEAGDRGHA
jgi:hypothetical protein